MRSVPACEVIAAVPSKRAGPMAGAEKLTITVSTKIR